MTTARRRTSIKEPENIPPHSPEAEIVVLGSILQSAEALKQTTSTLTHSDFYLDAHRHIFSACLALQTQGAPVDLLSVGELLNTRRQLQAVGGASYLAGLVDQTPSPANVAYYVRLVRDKAALRHIMHTCTRAAAQASNNGTDPGAILADLWEHTRQFERQGEPEATLPALDTATTVLRQMHARGDPIPTGLPALSHRFRGGVPTKKAVGIGGTTGAGKTTLALQIALAAAQAGCAVGCLMACEGRDPAIIRVGQNLGYIREQLEEGGEAVVEALERELAGRLLFFPDPDGEDDSTLEGVTEALARAYPAHRKLVVIDSLQTVRTRPALREAPSIRERIMEAARTARRLAIEHNLAMVYTSEVNRGWYRAKREEDRASDLSAFAEERIEFSADALVLMRATEEDPDLSEVRVPKNRLGGSRISFLLRLNRDRARYEEVDGDPRTAKQAEAEAARVDEMKAALLRVLTADPGVTWSQLKQLVGGKASFFGAALHAVKAAGLVTARRERNTVRHYLTEVPKPT